MADNPSFDFSSRDYANIRRDLLDRASRRIPEWTDRDPSDFATALVDLWAYTGDVMHYYIDRAAQEAFITSATKRESVLGLANLFDYTPRFRAAASGTVFVTNSSGASVNIPAGTSFSGIYNDTLYSFFASSSTTLSSGSTVGITLTEGKLASNQLVTSSANGQIGQRYTLPAVGVVPTSVRVFVAEGGAAATEWVRTANVNTLPPNTAGFSVYVNTDETVEIVFGNRLSGKIPAVGSTITATYATCSGAAGNVPANTVTSFASVTPTGLSLGTSSAFSSGADTESIESIKRSLKATVRTQERAVTIQDFADYANLTTGVYRAVASYTASAGASAGVVTLHAMPYTSNFTSYSGASVPVPTQVQTDLVTTIQPVALLGVTVAAATSVLLCRANLTAVVNVLPNYVATTVVDNVTNALNGLFELDQLNFGTEVRIGDIYRTILGVSGVDYVTISTYQIVDPNNGNAVVATFATSFPTRFLCKGSFNITSSGGITSA
jgi:uncharacterized phage protein gp47/JayE